MKFKVDKTIIKKRNKNTCAFRLRNDIVDPFYEICEKQNIVPSRLINQMIRHCLKDLGFKIVSKIK